VEQDQIGRREDVVSNVVEACGEELNVLAVEGCHERALQASVDLADYLVGLSLSGHHRIDLALGGGHRVKDPHETVGTLICDHGGRLE